MCDDDYFVKKVLPQSSEKTVTNHVFLRFTEEIALFCHDHRYDKKLVGDGLWRKVSELLRRTFSFVTPYIEKKNNSVKQKKNKQNNKK